MSHAYSGIHAGRYINAKFEGHSYLDYLLFLRQCGCQRQIVASNVRVVFHPDDYNITVRLYDTDILGYQPDGLFWAYHGGHVTMTTVTRMSQFGPDGVQFWRRNNEVWCTRGPIGCAPSIRYPVVRPHFGPEYEEHNPRVCPNPLARRRRTIRTRSEL